MRNQIVVGCIALLIAGMLFAEFANAEDWGHSGATPEPVKDSSRSGYWWWPVEYTSDPDDTVLWGNRGRIYGQYDAAPAPVAEKAPVIAPPPPQPPQTPPALEVSRTAPVFNETLFEFDSATLSEQGKSDLAILASYLKEHSGDTLEIQGHTCNVNRSGDPQYNEKLGLRRANSVMNALVEFGVANSRLTAVSFGESKPAVPNNSDSNRSLNRRVVFVLKLVD
jgi:outer membrane protein OmpA-like peptidoglycan-associated protein